MNTNIASFAAVFDLKATETGNTILNKTTAELYKPTKFIIGEDNSIKIKADPDSNIMLMISYDKQGAFLSSGEKLRLGTDYTSMTGVVPKNGVIEFIIPIDNDENMVGKIVYLEAAVWTEEDKSDIKLATIMGSNAKESISNGIIIFPKPYKPKGAGITPGIPGLSKGLLDTYNYLNKNLDQGLINIYDVEYNTKTPAIIRNMDALEEN